MAGKAEFRHGWGTTPWRMAGWGAGALVLLLPLVAMQFTSEVNWDLADFLVMGALLGGAGGALELAARKSGSLAYRAAAGVAILASFLLIWVNLAVGFLGSEDNPANLVFFGVISIAAVGSILARFQPAGMARALFATAAAQGLIGAVALTAGLGSPGADGLYEAVMGTSLFGALWLSSAWLFRKAAREQAPAGAPGPISPERSRQPRHGPDD